MSKDQELPESIKKLARAGGGLYRKILEEDLKRTPEEKVQAWQEAVAAMDAITHETDTDEIWDEVLTRLGVDPRTGRGLGS